MKNRTADKVNLRSYIIITLLFIMLVGKMNGQQNVLKFGSHLLKQGGKLSEEEFKDITKKMEKVAGDTTKEAFIEKDTLNSRACLNSSKVSKIRVAVCEDDPRKLKYLIIVIERCERLANGNYVRYVHHFSTFFSCPIRGGRIETNAAKALDGLKIFPNPASGDYFVVNIGVAPKEITVMDVTGKQVIQDRTNLVDGDNRIDISKLNDGVYIVRVLRKSGQQITQKLLIQ